MSSQPTKDIGATIIADSAASTPGPWEAGRIVALRAIGIYAGSEVIAEANVAPHHSEGTAQANANLIAAAPELYAALAEAHRALSHYQWYDEDAHGVRATNEAALAKARGAQ